MAYNVGLPLSLDEYVDEGLVGLMLMIHALKSLVPEVTATMCVKIWLRIQKHARELCSVPFGWPTLIPLLGRHGYIADEVCYDRDNLKTQGIYRGLIEVRNRKITRHAGGCWTTVGTKSVGLTKAGESMLGKRFGPEGLKRADLEVIRLCGRADLDSRSLAESGIDDVLRHTATLDRTVGWSHSTSLFRTDTLSLPIPLTEKQLKISRVWTLNAGAKLGPVQAGGSVRAEITDDWNKVRRSAFIKRKSDDSERFRMSIPEFRRHARLAQTTSLAGEVVQFFVVLKIIDQIMWRGGQVYVARATQSTLQPFHKDFTITILLDSQGIRRDLGSIARTFGSYVVEIIGVVLPQRDENDPGVPMVGVSHLTLFQELCSEYASILDKIVLEPRSPSDQARNTLVHWIGEEGGVVD